MIINLPYLAVNNPALWAGLFTDWANFNSKNINKDITTERSDIEPMAQRFLVF